MRTLLFKIGCAMAAITLLASVAPAAGPGDDPRFLKFKREMLRKVGQKVTVVGTLSDGKEGFWLAFNNWGAYIYAARESGINKENDLYTRFHRGEKVKVTGTLRYRPEPPEAKQRGAQAVQIAPETFFFDAAEVTMSRWYPPAPKHPK